MKRLLVWLLAIVATLASLAVAILYLAPGRVVSTLQASAARSAGLDSRTLDVDGDTLHYFIGGGGPPLVLLHGMGDTRHSFVAAAAELTDTHTVILPDMLGHGDNARHPDREHSIAAQVAHVDTLLDALGHDRVVLGGNSMGGHTAAAFTLNHPERVERLILVNAPGLPVEGHVVYAGFGGEIESREQYYAIMDRVVEERPALPGPVVDHMIAQTNRDVAFLDAAARDMREGELFDLSERLEEITVPTLILWGREDVVVPFEVAQRYRDGIPGAQLVVLDGMGHSPQLEQPEAVGKAIADFLVRN